MSQYLNPPSPNLDDPKKPSRLCLANFNTNRLANFLKALRLIGVIALTILTAAVAMAESSPVNLNALMLQLQNPSIGFPQKKKEIAESLKRINQHQKEYARILRDHELISLIEDKNILRAFRMLKSQGDKASQQSCQLAEEYLVAYNSFPSEEGSYADSKTSMALKTLIYLCRQ